MPARAPRKPAVAARPTPSVAEPTAPPFEEGAGAPAPDPTPAHPPAGAAPVLAQPGYRGLKVWQRAMDLATGVYLLSRTLPDDEQATVGAELRQTVVRIPASIAAGNSLFHRGEYLHALGAAHGAVARLESTLLVAERLGLVSGKPLAALLSNAGDVGRLLRGLIRALQPPDPDASAPTSPTTDERDPVAAG